MSAVGGYDPDDDELDFEDEDTKPALPRRVPSQGRRTVREDVRKAAESVDAGDLGDALKIMADVTSVLKDGDNPKSVLGGPERAEVVVKVAPGENCPEWQAPGEHHDHDTLDKVNAALKASGLTGEQAFDGINQMLNAGILFRERTVGTVLHEAAEAMAEDEIGDKYAGAEPAKAVAEESFEQQMVRVIPYHAFVKTGFLSWQAKWSTTAGVWAVLLEVRPFAAPQIKVDGPSLSVRLWGHDAPKVIALLRLMDAL